MSHREPTTTYCQECNRYVIGTPCAPNEIAECSNQGMRLHFVGRAPDTDAYYAYDSYAEDEANR